MNVHVDRIGLRLSGISRREAGRLAELVGQGLLHARAGAEAGSVEHVRVAIDARPGETVDAMAGRIAAAVSGSLTRSR